MDYSCVKRRSIYVEKVSETCYIDKSITLTKLTHHLPTNDGEMTQEVLAGTVSRLKTTICQLAWKVPEKKSCFYDVEN